jgi:hypothetical protein
VPFQVGLSATSPHHAKKRGCGLFAIIPHERPKIEIIFIPNSSTINASSSSYAHTRKNFQKKVLKDLEKGKRVLLLHPQ